MKILVACDSFKDALDAESVCDSIGKGLRAAAPEVEVLKVPLGDGGEGTARILGRLAGAKEISVTVNDALFRPIPASYYIVPEEHLAFMDMAAASGLMQLSLSERNPLHTSTFGTGQMILDAIRNRVKKLVIGIGGSATNDGGMGMACALGFRFIDRKGNDLKGIGSNMIKIDKIYSGPYQMVDLPPIEVLCDVKNPLYGPNGAAFIYAEQKGADANMIKSLDDGLKNMAAICQKDLGVNYSQEPGAGAAGGLGFGLKTFCAASLRSGIDAVLEYSQLSQHLKDVDLLLTGEGKLDAQTGSGKLISGLCKLAAAKKVPVIALCGKLEADRVAIEAMGLTAAFSINPPNISLEEALVRTAQHLEKASRSVMNNWILSKR